MKPMTLYLWELLFPKKTRPSRDELVLYVLKYLAECESDSHTHTITQELSGRTLTIELSMKESKSH